MALSTCWAPLCFLVCVLVARPSLAGALGRRPPEAPPAGGTPARPDPEACERALGKLDGQIRELLNEEVWRKPTPLGGFIFKLLGTQPFGVCSELFNFLVVEGAYPFKLDAFAQECTSRLEQNMRSVRYDECPNAAALQQRARESCRNGMRERVQLLNRDTERVMAAHLKCGEFGTGYLDPIPRGPRLDEVFTPAPPVPPTGGAPPVRSEITPPATGVPLPPDAAAGPELTPPLTGMTEQTPPVADAPPPIPGPGFCCERCPGTDRDRLYVPMAPDTECQPGDVRRDDLTSGAQGPCANPLTEAPGPPTYGEACCAGKNNQVRYDTVPSGSVQSDVGSTLRSACEPDPCTGKVEGAPGSPRRVEASILSTGPDINGRDWVPEHPILKLGKDRLKPCHTEPFYVTKEATMQGAATAVFTAMGLAQDAERAEASKGSACQGGGHHESATERAAKAAALGLLATQMKGQMKGLRAMFDVTGREEAARNATLQADIVNTVTQRRERLSLPVRFPADEAAQ